MSICKEGEKGLQNNASRQSLKRLLHVIPIENVIITVCLNVRDAAQCNNVFSTLTLWFQIVVTVQF